MPDCTCVSRDSGLSSAVFYLLERFDYAEVCFCICFHGLDLPLTSFQVLHLLAMFVELL